MLLKLQAKIVDITERREYERYLYRCLAPAPFRKYKPRREFLEMAIPKGFRMKLLISDGDVIGQIEYAPAEVSGYPISGSKIVVMMCVWVLRRAKGHDFGKQLVEDMIKSEEGADGFAAIALENHWSPWFLKWQMEKLGFKPLDSIRVVHKAKREEQAFTVYLMWMPIAEDAKPPNWDKKKLLEGVTFCMAHPLYRPQKVEGNILEEVRS
jgi:N-acetylglutamate synthase-like GNAT family acetyltransferase